MMCINEIFFDWNVGEKGIVVILAIVIPVGVVLGVVTTILLVIRYKWRSKHKMPLSGNTTTEVYTLEPLPNPHHRRFSSKTGSESVMLILVKTGCDPYF